MNRIGVKILLWIGSGVLAFALFLGYRFYTVTHAHLPAAADEAVRLVLPPIIIALVVLALGLGVILQLVVVRRLTRMAAHLSRAAQETDPRRMALVPGEGGDEIGGLAAGCNTLIERLQAVYGDLDVQVQARTRELEAANRQLLAEAQGRQETVSELQKSEERFRHILDRIEEAYFEIDLDGCFVFVNQPLAQMSGFRRRELTGLCHRRLVSPETGEAMTQAMSRILAGSDRERLPEHRLQTRDGRSLFLDLSVSPIRDEDGAVVGFRATGRDLGERLQAQGELQRTVAFYRTILDSMYDAVAIIDVQDFRIRAVNQVFLREYGLAEAEVLGQTCHATTHGLAQPCSGPQDPCPLVYTLATGEHAVVEHLHHLPDGREVVVEVATSPIRDEGGRIVQVVHVSRDVTARKQADAALRQAVAEAEAANRAKGEFLANMSHEIRTPLNAIIGMTTLALQAEPEPGLRVPLETIHDAARLLAGTLSDVLDLSKIEAGRLELERAPFALRPLVEGILELFAPQALAKGLDLTAEVEPQVPQEVVGDSLRLNQILVNLTSNAVKFTEQGGVALRVSLLELGEEWVRLAFAVTDTGIGIAAGDQERLFAPFTQADGSTTRRYGGTGLGLAIVRRLAELMAGGIEVKSQPGQGSTFTLVVDLELGEEETAGAAASREGLAGRRVLVVDDHELHCQTLIRTLTGWGLEVEAVAQAAAVLPRLQQVRTGAPAVSLVLLAWRQADSDALGLLEGIRVDPDLAATPVVLATTLRREADMEQARRAGATAVLPMPLRPSRLLAFLVDLWAGGSGPRPPAAGHRALPVAGSLRGATILLAEDNPINVVVATRLLSHLGVAVKVVENGRQAVEAVEAGGHYDAVLMDVQMPQMDGYQATAGIRALATGRHLPIIAMTAHALADDRQRCLAAGMDDFLTKPVELATLAATLGRWVAKSSGALAEPVPEPPPAVTAGQLPPAAGLDLAAGIARLAGDRTLYHQLLAQFAASQSQAGAVIREALGRGDREAARRAVHTVKGLAGNLAAFGLAEAARQLETAISQGEEVAARMDGFQAALSQVLATIAELPAGEEARALAPAGSGETLGLLLAQVAGLLRSHDLEAEAILRQCAALSRPEHQEAMDRLVQLVMRLQFAEALAGLEDLARDLNPRPH
ncbi:MAG: PAS domain S-box protein [Thermodesulfobacteriota bacterium]